jgi:O-antigen/teichoic acid export membrane protein
MKFREAAICSAGASMGRVGGAVVCAALGGGIWSFAAGEISATTIGAWLTRSLSGYHFKYHLILDWLVVREVRSFMSGIMGINLAVSINTKIDNMVIGKMLGAQALGYYNLAYQLAMIPLYTISSINSVNFSVLSQKDNEGRRIYIANALELFAVLSALIYGVGFVVAPWLIPLLYGSEWIEAVSLFQIILVFAYARGFMAILGISLVAADKPGINAAINFALVPITIPSFIVGAQLGGTTGVAIAVAVVLGIFATVWFWIATCHVSDWNIKVLVKPVLLPTVAITLIVAAVLAIPFPTELRIYLQPIVVVITYGMVLTVFSKGHIPQMLMKLVKHTLNKHST